MSNTWWVNEGQLDKYQKKVITLPLEGSHFVTGPPGSGKTNLLLLRANYLHLAKHGDLEIIVFTGALRKFIELGCEQYEFPSSKVKTCRSWQNDLLRQYGKQFTATGKFEEQRQQYITALEKLIETHDLSDIYDCVLLDEAQDYRPEEMKIFHKLARTLFCVADSRQQIYDGDDPLDTLEQLIGEPIPLKYHYRNGINVCRVADHIANSTVQIH